ncbi:MAG: hypothetical protein MUC77_21390 [Chromatiaceae bacterium]|nr:hypothetical protein [Chromatiaceae bacterium]
MAFDPAKPYNELPILPPVVDVESRAVLKVCIAARAAVAELKAAGQLIPNQGVLINSIPLLEAQASALPDRTVGGLPGAEDAPPVDEHGRTNLPRDQGCRHGHPKDARHHAQQRQNPASHLHPARG